MFVRERVSQPLRPGVVVEFGVGFGGRLWARPALCLVDVFGVGAVDLVEFLVASPDPGLARTVWQAPRNSLLSVIADRMPLPVSAISAAPPTVPASSDNPADRKVKAMAMTAVAASCAASDVIRSLMSLRRWCSVSTWS